jgi:squalene-hopene/tetraprenyl-beta-curcumene cyclase
VEVEPGGITRLEPCRSPVWDTAITTIAVVESAAGGAAARAAADRAVDWLLANEIRSVGDWADRVQAEPSGWCFEYANRFYPDVDDTAMVVIAFSIWRRDAVPGARLAAVDAAIERAVAWTAAMQNADGGWGAFDRDNNCEFLCKVPFADHNAMIDPSSPDLAGRVLEALGRVGIGPGNPAVDRGLAYVRRTQEPDGSWEQPEFTGTGFPRVFYLRYHWYPIYFPLISLVRARRMIASGVLEKVA